MAAKVSKKRKREEGSDDLPVHSLVDLETEESTQWRHGKHVWTVTNVKATVIDRCYTDKDAKSDAPSRMLARTGTFTIGPAPAPAGDDDPTDSKHNRWFLELASFLHTKDDVKDVKVPMVGIHLYQDAPRWNVGKVHFAIHLGDTLVEDQWATFAGDGVGYGLRFAVTEDVWKSKMHYDSATDTLRIKLIVQIPMTRTVVVPGFTAFDVAPSYATLLRSGAHSDVVVESADGARIPAHQLVLRSRSPVFDLVLKQPMHESLSRSVRVEANGRVVRAMLWYIYTGRTRHVDRLVTGWDDAVSLFETAQFYSLPELAMVAGGLLTRSATIANAMDVVKLAARYCDNVWGDGYTAKRLAASKTPQEDGVGVTASDAKSAENNSADAKVADAKADDAKAADAKVADAKAVDAKSADAKSENGETSACLATGDASGAKSDSGDKTAAGATRIVKCAAVAQKLIEQIQEFLKARADSFISTLVATAATNVTSTLKPPQQSSSAATNSTSSVMQTDTTTLGLLPLDA